MNFCFDHWELDFTSKSYKDTPSAPSSSSSRKVNYAKTCAVILIPSREEYFSAGIFKNLWYNQKDLKLSQYHAANELKSCMDDFPIMGIEAAMIYLYQPKIDIFYKYLNGRKFNLLIIDDNVLNANKMVDEVKNSHPHWNWSSYISNTGEHAIQLIKNSNYLFDIILIDESVVKNGKSTLSYDALITILKLFNRDTFIGCTITSNIVNFNINDTKKEALRSGCDFVWNKPISQFTKMLPILFSIRMKAADKPDKRVEYGEIAGEISGEVPREGPGFDPTFIPLRKNESEITLASLDGLDTINSQEHEYNCTLNGLIHFHDKFELRKEKISNTGVVLKNSIVIENKAILENVNIRDYDDLINSELCSDADENINNDDIDDKLESCHENDDGIGKIEGLLSPNTITAGYLSPTTDTSSLCEVEIEGLHTVLSNNNLIVNDINNGGNYKHHYINGKKNDVYDNSKSEDGGTTDDTNSTIS
mmetsp:Transcript_8152/g.8168  ORF Transcript_8152/g.8168 Transcript_8152/m.8168 type:complete len:477 (-) Transcript_8152:41-1471(-)